MGRAVWAGPYSGASRRNGTKESMREEEPKRARARARASDKGVWARRMAFQVVTEIATARARERAGERELELEREREMARA